MVTFLGHPLLAVIQPTVAQAVQPAHEEPKATSQEEIQPKPVMHRLITWLEGLEVIDILVMVRCFYFPPVYPPHLMQVRVFVMLKVFIRCNEMLMILARHDAKTLKNRPLCHVLLVYFKTGPPLCLLVLI